MNTSPTATSSRATLTTVTLSTIFAKPIDRPIEGVIKADDDASLRQEVEEYVLTREVAKRLEDFLAAYNDYNGANGVWISGFFGSGKSHLLKMLALLLENRTIDGIAVLNSFLDKCGENEFLRAELKKAVSIPAQSILFNIDQKADVISKTQIDALLAVFVKVFDETCGYYGKQGHIAQFERDLDSRGLYERFQVAYAAIANQPWERGREQALLEKHNIAAAYAEATGAPQSSAANILDEYRAQYKVSIEDFAEMVYAYVERKGENFRLNFFVDEVGQYIADNTKLMTNLQTLAESLATKCRGRAWIVVTAQEDMTDVVGEMTKRQANDFTKIMARFANRMKLTSTDVAEVIQKRLLQKNDLGIDLLARVYAAQQNNFRTLFDLDGRRYRTFRDCDDFIHSYPFIPYQFDLFQEAIKSLSQHNAFEGRHSSVGERSMLGVFQQVAKQIGPRPIGRLATFDLMFEGIRTALKSQVQGSILAAEQNLGDDFAVRVLKALFLVKYVKEFKATVRNLTVLMLDSFEADLPALRKRIEASLALLEQQTYIQRTGETYEYLTNEEKDIEQEIKNTEVGTDIVLDELHKLIFEEVLRDRKIRYDENGQDYAFARKLDDTPYGRQAELAIHVISPFHEHAGNETILRSQSMGRDELLVMLPPSDRLMSDLVMHKKTEKYVRQNVSTTQRESVKRLLEIKQSQNRQRRDELIQLVRDLVGQATLAVAGDVYEVGGSDPQTRIQRGFHELITRTYPHLRMLRGMNYSENDIATYLQQGNSLFNREDAAFGEAEQEVLAFIRTNRNSGLRSTMQTLVQHFERKPYGWYLAAIQCTLAKLLARGRVEVRRDGTLLDGAELARALRNTHGFANLVFEPQVDFTPGQVSRLKQFYADFFDSPAQHADGRALAQATLTNLKALIEELRQLRREITPYSFAGALDEPLAQVEEIAAKPYAFFLTELDAVEDGLLDAKEQVIDPLRRFMAGPLRTIYDEARTFLDQQHANLGYIQGDDAQAIRQLLDDPACFQGSRMQQVKSRLDALAAALQAQIEQERDAGVQRLAALRAALEADADFAKLTAQQQADLVQPFDALRDELDRAGLIAVIRDRIRQFDEVNLPTLYSRMVAWARPPVAPPTSNGDDGKVAPLPVEPPVNVVTLGALTAHYAKPWLDNEDDVLDYLAALETALLDAVADGKRVKI